jgi:hypothetical protein
MGCKGGD